VAIVAPFYMAGCLPDANLGNCSHGPLPTHLTSTMQMRDSAKDETLVFNKKEIHTNTIQCVQTAKTLPLF